MNQHKLQLESLPKMHVAVVSYKGNYIGNAQIFKNLIDTLMGWAGPKGLITEKMTLFSSYPDDYETTKPEDMTVEVCIPVPENTSAEWEVITKTLPGGNYAVMEAELAGPQEYAEAWTAIVKWAGENNVSMDTSRPSYEFYLNNPAKHPENHHLVKICLSVS